MPPHARKLRHRVAAAIGLLALPLTLTACQQAPADPTQNFLRVETQISAVDHKTYEVRVSNPASQGQIDMILASGNRAAQWVPQAPVYRIQVDTVKSKSDNLPGLNRTPHCDLSVNTDHRRNIVIVVTEDGCRVEH